MIRYDQLESARTHNKSSNLSVKACINHGLYKPRLVLIRNNRQIEMIRKQGATPAKGRCQTIATTPHHVTCALGLSADPTKHNPRLALA